jgi:hypothetical protein
MQTGFIIIDENRCGDVHCINKNQSFGDSAFLQALIHLPGNVDKTSARIVIKP